ncbi:hypothetical protein [Nocardia sp. X0981]
MAFVGATIGSHSLLVLPVRRDAPAFSGYITERAGRCPVSPVSSPPPVRSIPKLGGSPL